MFGDRSARRLRRHRHESIRNDQRPKHLLPWILRRILRPDGRAFPGEECCEAYFLRIVGYTYVDHQEEIGYPIRLVTQNLVFCEAIHFFGSDAGNLRHLEEIRENHSLKDRIFCHQIDRKVDSPGDIAAAQNSCLSWMRQNESFDFVIGLQADTMIGHRGIDLIRRITDSKRSAAEATLLPVDHVRIYAVAHRTRYGCAVIGKDSKAVFIKDGAYTDPYSKVPEEENDPGLFCIDVGYYTPEMYYRHVSRNARTWKSSDGVKLCEAYGRSRDEFIRHCLKRVWTYERGDIPLTPINPGLPDHAVIMDYFKCHD